MRIDIYTLLGLVKDGKAPKKIKFRNEIYEYISDIENSIIDYVGIEKETSERFYLSSHIGNNYISNIFTDEVEILDEEPKPITKESIEALGYACGEIRKCFENGWNKLLENKPLIEEDKKLEKLTIDSEWEKGVYVLDLNGLNNNLLRLTKYVIMLSDEINNLKEND